MQMHVYVASLLKFQTLEGDQLQYPQKSTEISHQKGLAEEG